MNPIDPNAWFKLWTDSQGKLWEAWTDSARAVGNVPAAAGLSPDGGWQQMNDLLKKTMEGWIALAQQGSAAVAGNFDAMELRKLFDPAEWSKVWTDRFDVALERMTEGPAYATLWDIDRKLVNLQKLTLERVKDIAHYHSIVQATWNQALVRFMQALNDPSGAPLTSGRDVLDLWIATANAALLEMHRSEAFLDAQRRMTRSATECRLQEREIAEALCEAHHIPTRTEMDEVQRATYELRRDLRALQRARASGPVTPSGTARRATRKRKASEAQ
jgi:poly[(R)-3-hydroxyalkanoate] polymerase subunit PhaE